MRLWESAGCVVLLACCSIAQELSPEVIRLARFKAHMRAELAALPNYTCLETISRFHKRNSNSPLQPLDRVRLEVIYSDHREWYGSPGDRTLDVGDPAKFVGSGLIGTGPFAGALVNILNGAQFQYRGETAVEGRDTVQYDFSFLRRPNAFEITMTGGTGTVGEKGSVWFDPQTLDLVRLQADADEIPSYLPLAEQTTAVNYAHTRIGNDNVLLAQQADVRLVERAGPTNYDHFEFTHCRVFASDSSISFGEETEDHENATPVTAPSGKTAQVPPLPALLRVPVQLDTPISNQDAIGQLIQGHVVGSVMRRGTVAIPDGAAVRGRIRRLERYVPDSPQKNADLTFIVGLEFTEVDLPEGRVPFYADLLSVDAKTGIRATLSERYPVGKETITLSELPGLASFFVFGKDFVRGATLNLPAGLKTIWRTRGPIRGM